MNTLFPQTHTHIHSKLVKKKSSHPNFKTPWTPISSIVPIHAKNIHNIIIISYHKIAVTDTSEKNQNNKCFKL